MSRAYVDILRELVSFRTVSSETNLELLSYVESYLQKLGFATKRVPERTGQGEKTNLLAWVGPDIAGGVMLAGHSDVVPTEGQDWSHDPFDLRVTNEKLVGRGTADMKGFLALVLAVCAQADLSRLKRRLWLSFTYDEEVGCLGVRELLDELSSVAAKPRLVLIGEPTDGEVVFAHKGIGIYRTRVKGRPAHSSRPDLGRNAIEHAMRLFADFDELLPDRRDDQFTPPYCTANIGLVDGGSATNIIAEHCQVDWEVRPLPHTDVQEVSRLFAERAEERSGTDAPTVNTQVQAEVPALGGARNQAAVKEMCELLGKMRATTAPFVTEGGLYEEAGLLSVVCGPGELSQAHQPDESVRLAAMDQFETALSRLVEKECKEDIHG